MAGRDHTIEQLATVLGDKYEVLQWIGGGGMAEVYLARHRMHGGLAAVKVMAEHLAGNPAVVERFLQEARTAASLSGHPNIVTIFDVGGDQGLYYLIMQYIDGEDLKTYLERKGRLEPSEAVQILSQVAQALTWAHAKGVVHRDLKPSNIRLDQNGRAIVLDFGIAKAGAVPSALTMMGERLGTPYYMAPEQIRGEPCDGRTDLYALGLIFFEMLTGRRCFSGQSYYEIEHAQLNTPAPSPSDVDPAIPQVYSRVALRLMEKDPGRRYQSAEEVLEDLKALAAPEHIPLPPAPPPGPAEAGAGAPKATAVRMAPAARSRIRFILGGAAAAALLLAAAIAVFATRGRQAPAAKSSPGGAAALAARIETPTGAMVLVPGGAFSFGSNEAESPNPAWTVTLPDFYIDAAEVSNAAFREFCQATGRTPPEAAGGPEYPVANVTLDDARAFAQWAGKRLPTEEEWEKAARGTDGRTYPWGNTPPQPSLANLGSGKPIPVDGNPEGASPYGLRNMAGNVWEWTVSRYPVTEAEIADMRKLLPSAGTEWNVIKGGSYAPQTGELWARTYMRRGFPATERSPWIGFRCVKDAK